MLQPGCIWGWPLKIVHASLHDVAGLMPEIADIESINRDETVVEESLRVGVVRRDGVAPGT
jgi:hypothetical protein